MEAQSQRGASGASSKPGAERLSAGQRAAGWPWVWVLVRWHQRAAEQQ
jgi:hypothetical protein